MKRIELRALRATPARMDELEAKGLLRRLRPSEAAVAVKEGEDLVETVERGQEKYGPWQMLSVACNRTRLEYLAAHSDIESWLYFSAAPSSKPLLYVVATCPAEAFRDKAAQGTLTADDICVLEIMPNDPETSFFTVPGEVLHDELTFPGPGVAPVFFVPEASQMVHSRVSLDDYEIVIVRDDA